MLYSQPLLDFLLISRSRDSQPTTSRFAGQKDVEMSILKIHKINQFQVFEPLFLSLSYHTRLASLGNVNSTVAITNCLWTLGIWEISQSLAKREPRGERHKMVIRSTLGKFIDAHSSCWLLDFYSYSNLCVHCCWLVNCKHEFLIVARMLCCWWGNQVKGSENPFLLLSLEHSPLCCVL